jgi:hypothetical protein
MIWSFSLTTTEKTNKSRCRHKYVPCTNKPDTQTRIIITII